MKRTSFLLASLTAIVLLSCSNDNSNPFTEDVSYPQTQALQKVIPDDEAQQTCSSASETATSQSIGVTITTSGATVSSNEYCFTKFSTLPADAIITGVSLYTGTMTYTGGVLTNYWQIRKGPVDYTRITNGGAPGGATISTNYFNGLPARDTYCVLVNVTCVGFGSATFCSKLYKNVKLTISYCQP